MSRRPSTFVIAAAVLVCLATPAFAQSERINIRQAPRPDQTVKMTMNQGMDMDLTIDGLPAGGGPVKMAMRMILEMTQKTGTARPDGSYDSELTYGQFHTTIEMNGQPLPGVAPPNQLEGKTLTVTYDRNGQITDVKDSAGGGIATDAVRQMLRSFSANLPVSTIAVGETVTTPLEFSIPLPIPGGGAPMKMSGETKMKLVSVNNDGGSRVARFESTSDGKISTGQSDPAAGGVNIDLTLGGGGTTLIDIDKGVMRSGETRATFSGKVSGGTAAPALPGITMQGTMTVTIASN